MRIVPTEKVFSHLGLGRRAPVDLAFFDPEPDIARFTVRIGRTARREERPWGGVFEYNEADELVGVEVRFASAMLPGDFLKALPAPDPD